LLNFVIIKTYHHSALQLYNGAFDHFHTLADIKALAHTAVAGSFLTELENKRVNMQVIQALA